MQKLSMGVLQMTFKTETVRLLWPEQFDFIVKNAYAYLNAEPDVLVSIDQDRLSVSQLMQVQARMDQQVAQEKQAAEQAAIDAKYNLSGANLTGGVGAYRQ